MPYSTNDHAYVKKLEQEKKPEPEQVQVVESEQDEPEQEEYVERVMENYSAIIDSVGGNVSENYESDKEFKQYVNKMDTHREKTTVKGLRVDILDVIDNLNKRIMYLEYKYDISYEKDNSKYMNYNKIISLMRKKS